MKQKLKPRIIFYGLSCLFIMSVLFYACNSYNFSDPQPSDKKNILAFPREMLGSWLAADEGDYDSYLVYQKHILITSHKKIKIVTGAWPQLNEKGEYIRPSATYKVCKTIQYDSLHTVIDTITNYLVWKNKIYEINEDGFLDKGNFFTVDKDTLNVYTHDTLIIDLGKNAFLRQLNNHFYVLNIRNSILGNDAAPISNWWRVMLLEIREDKTLHIWECADKSQKLDCMFYERPSKSDIFYFDCNWTSADILRLAKEGYFEVSNKLYRKMGEKL